MMKTRGLIALVLLAALILAGPASAGILKDYVGKSDDSYKYAVHSTLPVQQSTAYIVRMTSQTWHGLTWDHWVAIFKPENVKYPDKALLFIGGGDNTEETPDLRDQESQVLAMIAGHTHAVVARIWQVPNQPLFDGKYEDAIIAYTFERFGRGEGDDWPLLLPMVKSAVRAMDTVQSVAREKWEQDIKQFMVTGASKRGWTTWLTAAADPRVAAIAPMVIDMLNMGPQMAHQKKCYGGYSEQVADYTELKIQDYLQTPAGKKLSDIVDPYSYRDQLALPKTIILGTNDEYWTVDSAKFYFNDFPGPKWIHYEPNAGHGLNLNIVPVVAAQFHAMLTGGSMPHLEWKFVNGHSLQVSWDDPEATAALWHAQAPTRDFRKARWVSSELIGKCTASVELTKPETGYAAYFVAITFPLKLENAIFPFSLTTLTYVLPDTYQSFDEHPDDGKK